MAKLSSFKRDTTAFNDGDWVRPDPGEDFEIRTRGLGDAYADAQAAKQRRAAKGFGGDAEKLPVAMKRRINVECLIDHALLDVRGLEHDDGRSVSFSEFCDMLRSDEYPTLVAAAFTAATMVGDAQRADVEDAAGNSAPGSASSSNGAATPPC
ncbi:hypothetical protein FHW79_001671 [Azospirillum sp. OGB3]|uniref:hypothetical protein n=1 Tax=Azospirillum sp. OGB3 TaxID=2587012 RepID=UPI001605B8B9|nr:hypothetical protein [Azospirillum sp. OGB3]MBB3264056.1 hypothetical protein [Azospirillum sp. OGB3]